MEKNMVYVDRDLQEIIPLFLKNREEDIQKLKKAVAEKNFDLIKILGHNMKGAGSGYGFHAVTQLGKALEEGAEKKDTDFVQSTVQDLEAYMGGVEIHYQ